MRRLAVLTKVSSGEKGGGSMAMEMGDGHSGYEAKHSPLKPRSLSFAGERWSGEEGGAQSGDDDDAKRGSRQREDMCYGALSRVLAR